ncbi:hypothetical protein FACS189419_01910 [Planctomycetales bacterium]|nr:hypothetical protein FACS189419_01910 [Planctomycetales bacterium]
MQGTNKTTDTPKEFGQPTRTITDAAKKRMCFTRQSVVGLGWLYIGAGAFFLIPAADWDFWKGFFFIWFSAFGCLSILLEWLAGRKAIRLLERGVAVSGIVRKVPTLTKIQVELLDEQKDILNMPLKNAYLRSKEPINNLVGQSVTAFINPVNRKEAILFENNVPVAVSYDITTNTFDSDFKQPYFLLPFAVLFVIAVIIFVVLLIRLL